MNQLRLAPRWRDNANLSALVGKVVRLRFHLSKGSHLFVNVDCPEGELKAEVLDRDGKVIEPFTLTNCKAVSCDKTLAAVTWQGAADLSVFSGKPVRLRFHLKSGSLYAFWVSPDRSGASHGYVAAGGPGFTGATDTVGLAAAKAACADESKDGSDGRPRPQRIGHGTAWKIAGP